MGCGSSSDEKEQPRSSNQSQGQWQQPQMGWGGPGNQVVVQPPNPNDPPFLQTVAPSGTTWGQYVRTGSSFVDPSTGFLAGPWAECIAWGVLFEHQNDWERIPQYAADGVVGGILIALRNSCATSPQRDRIMEAADRLEAAAHQLAEAGEPMPAINQVVMVPDDAVPGQRIRIENPQSPGTYMNVQVPPNAQPGQPILAPAPVQPNKSGGMSTGAKVGLAAGGVVAAGALAGAVYYGTAGGGIDGFVGDAGAAADWAGGAAGDAADWAGGAAGDVGDFAGGAAGDVADWVTGDAADWAGGAIGDVGDFAGGAVDDIGGLMDSFF